MIGPSAALHVDWTASARAGAISALYFFKTEQYIRWDVETETLAAGYPKNISEGWPGLQEHFPGVPLCGAIHVPGWDNRIFFFFRGQDKAASWDVAADCVDPELTPISLLLPTTLVQGGPFAPIYVDRIESQSVYVFRGDEYTRFTVTEGVRPSKDDDGYPRKIGQGWTGGLTVAPRCGVCVNWPNRSNALKNHKAYFFLGELYTRWDIGTHSNNYRLDIPAGWKGWPDFT